MKYLVLISTLLLNLPSFSQMDITKGGSVPFPNLTFETIQPNASRVDFDQFLALAMEVKAHRAKRLVAYATFMQMFTDSNTVILDTRSKEMYDKQHIKGAIHLNFSDFNVWSLSNLIPDTSTRILIYCNNNFDYTRTEIPIQEQYYISKSVTPNFKEIDPILLLPGGQKKLPLTMALNVPTYINLYGYGYKNVYELADLIPVYYGDIKFEGTAIDPETGYLNSNPRLISNSKLEE